MILEYMIARDQWEQQTRENSARQAFAWGTFESTGWGEYAYEDVLDFGLVFLSQPIVSYSFSVDGEGLDYLPLCAGGVYKWQRDERGFYLGAHVYVHVTLPDITLIDPETPPLVTHHFLFTTIAIKDIGADEFRDG